MPYSRSRRSRRSGYRNRRRSYRRRYYRRAKPSWGIKTRSNKVHVIERTVTNEVSIYANTVPAGNPGVVTFMLEDISDYSLLSGGWDMYRILSADVTFIYNRNVAYAETTEQNADVLNAGLPIGYFAQDHDDSIVPVDHIDVEKRAGAKVVLMDKPFRTRVYPSIMNVIYKPGASFAYGIDANQKNQWIDTATPNVPYLGVKFFIRCMGIFSGSTAIKIGSMLVVKRLKIALRDSR